MPLKRGASRKTISSNIRELRKRMNDEVGTLRRAVVEKQQKDDAAYAQLSTRVETLQKKLAEMEVEATLDPLTKVGNRRRFQTSLSRMFSAAQQSGTTLSLAMIDVDHFKVVNDTHVPSMVPSRSGSPAFVVPTTL